MNGFNVSIARAAIASITSDLQAQPAVIAVFSYNPDGVSRRVRVQSTGGSIYEDIGFDAHRVSGPPRESIEMSIEIDATDQLEDPSENPAVVTHGLGPALAALELLLYPKTADVIERRARLALGEVQVASLEVPIALLIWGASRVVPVKLTSLSITEQAFDTNLNPIRAEASVSFDVLSYENLPLDSLGAIASMADHARKETLALFETGDAVDFDGLLPF